MPDVWFEVLIIAGLALLTWRRDAPVWLVAAGAFLLGGSATVRQVGEILILPALVGALLTTQGWRRRSAYAAVAAAAFAAPIIGYMSLAQAVTGHFWLSHSGVTTTYGRMASAADCATLTLPASERPLCPTPAQQASGPDELEHSPHSPLRPYYRNLPHSEASRLVASFNQHVLHQQPGRVLVSIGRDAVKLFALTRDGAPGDTPIARWQFQHRLPGLPAARLAGGHRGRRGPARRRRAHGRPPRSDLLAQLSAPRWFHAWSAVRHCSASRSLRVAIRTAFPPRSRRRSFVAPASLVSPGSAAALREPGPLRRRLPRAGRGGPPGRRGGMLRLLHRRGGGAGDVGPVRILLAVPAAGTGHAGPGRRPGPGRGLAPLTCCASPGSA